MDIEGLYFFGSYGLGMLAYRARLSRITAKGWGIIFVLGLVALLLEPRVRMGLAWVLALLLAAWPQSRPIEADKPAWRYLRQGLAHVARQSYSIFLAHFGVSLCVSALWFHADWQAPWLNVLGLGVSLLLSLWAGNVLYRQVENKKPTLSRLLAWQTVFVFSGLAVMAWARFQVPM